VFFFIKNLSKEIFLLRKKRGADIKALKAIVAKLQRNIPLKSKHRDHRLSENWTGFRACHIQPDWLLIYKKEDTADGIGVLQLEATETHADLFS